MVVMEFGLVAMMEMMMVLVRSASHHLHAGQCQPGRHCIVFFSDLSAEKILSSTNEKKAFLTQE